MNKLCFFSTLTRALILNKSLVNFICLVSILSIKPCTDTCQSKHLVFYFFIIYLFYSMFVYFIMLKKVTWMLEKNVCLYISMSQTLWDMSHFFSYLTCLSKYGKNIFELTLIGSKFKISSKNVHVFEEKKVTRNKNFNKPTSIREREKGLREPHWEYYLVFFKSAFKLRLIQM